MPKTQFVNGTVVTPDWLNSQQDLIFDGQDQDGHYPLISNNDLSNAAGQIKPEWTTFRDSLKAEASAGLTVSYRGGSVVLPNNTITTIAPGTLLLSDNATNFVFINTSGAVAASTTMPVSGLMLARVVTVSGAISGAIEDLRPRFAVLPRAAAIKVFGGTGDQGVYNLTGTDTFTQGEYYFSSFSVQATATLTIDKGARIFVSGPVLIAGTINVTQAVNGGSNFSTATTGNIGGLSGAGPGGGSGSGVGSSYNYTLAPHGSGGGTGFAQNSTTTASTPGAGGRGGGGLIIEAALTVSITGAVNVRGGNGGTGTIDTGTGINVSGGGGGSGGLLLIKSLTSITIGATSTIDVRGGNGGNGLNAGAPGGGGGGGQVVLISPSNNTTGATILLAGGALGTSPTTPTLGGGAGGGFGGVGGSNGQLIIRNFIPVA
jgi:hypothetical protein